MAFDSLGIVGQVMTVGKQNIAVYVDEDIKAFLKATQKYLTVYIEGLIKDEVLESEGYWIMQKHGARSMEFRKWLRENKI